MTQKCIFLSILLMGVLSMFTTSCVQGDLYDDLYDDSDEWSAPRNKKGKDCSALQILESDGPCGNECVAYVIAYRTNKDFPTVRRDIGTRIFGTNWQVPYINACITGDGLTLSSTLDVITNLCGVKEQPLNQVKQLCNSSDGTATLPNGVIAQVNNQHWVILLKVKLIDDILYPDSVSDNRGSGHGYNNPITRVMW